MVEGNKEVGWSHWLRPRLPLRGRRQGCVPRGKASGQEGGPQVGRKCLE